MDQQKIIVYQVLILQIINFKATVTEHFCVVRYNEVKLQPFYQVFCLGNIPVHVINAPDLNAFSHQFKFVRLKLVDKFLQV